MTSKLLTPALDTAELQTQGANCSFHSSASLPNRHRTFNSPSPGYPLGIGSSVFPSWSTATPFSKLFSQNILGVTFTESSFSPNPHPILQQILLAPLQSTSRTPPSHPFIAALWSNHRPSRDPCTAFLSQHWSHPATTTVCPGADSVN